MSELKRDLRLSMRIRVLAQLRDQAPLHESSAAEAVWLREAADELDRLHGLYQQLIMAVGNKYEGESRHETALRYILRAEEQTPDDARANAA